MMIVQVLFFYNKKHYISLSYKTSPKNITMKNIIFLIITCFTLSLNTACESDVDVPIEINDQDGDSTGGDDENGGDGTGNSSTVVEAYGLLKTSGNKIVDKNNNPIQLRGMSM